MLAPRGRSSEKAETIAEQHVLILLFLLFYARRSFRYVLPRPGRRAVSLFGYGRIMRQLASDKYTAHPRLLCLNPALWSSLWATDYVYRLDLHNPNVQSCLHVQMSDFCDQAHLLTLCPDRALQSGLQTSDYCDQPRPPVLYSSPAQQSGLQRNESCQMCPSLIHLDLALQNSLQGSDSLQTLPLLCCLSTAV